jgi:RNA polymerase sigma-70 factor (ECF subfamily)
LTDEKIVELVLSGHTEAFREIVERYKSRIAATVIGMLGNCPEAEDVGQEVFIRFYQNLKNFRGDSTVATYLTRIAINLSLNEIKKRKRSTFFSGKNNGEFLEIEDTSGSKPYSDEKENVQKAIKKLEPKYRIVVVLRMIEGYSTTETAEILGLPLGTVLSRLARAQQKLKKILTPLIGEKV